MSAKQFFKSTAFKCIAVLLAIVIICGVFLTICNSLFYVSDKERLDRAIAKLYGESVEYNELDVDSNVSVTGSKVNSVYEITTYEGNYLLSVTGEGGYSGGTVTCWVVVEVKDGAVSGVKKASIASNVNQSYISKIKASDIQAVIDKQDESGFTTYNTNGIKTGASFSMGAIAASINGAVDYVNAEFCGAVAKYGEYEYSSYIDDTTEISVENGVVTYNIVTKPNSPATAFSLTIKVDSTKKITQCTVTVNGTYQWGKPMLDKAKDMTGLGLDDIKTLIAPMLSDGAYNSTSENGSNEINTGATKSNFLCLYAGLFATANYDKAISDLSQGGNS
jgi:hypothetical protein